MFKKNKLKIDKFKKYFFSDRIIYIFIILILVCLIIFNKPEDRNKFLISHDKSTQYQFTNPILDCEFEIENSALFLEDINKETNKLKTKYSLDSFSFYYRELNNGVWFGINEKEYFSPASLLKVPILVGFLKNVEKDNSLLNKKVIVQEQDFVENVNSNIVSYNLLERNREYSLLEVAEHLIQKSDNTAIPILFENISEDYLEEVFKAVGLNAIDGEHDTEIRVKDYAGLFRVLFNSSYLGRDMSELALNILSSTEFDQGIVAGLPKNIKVSHKFGERKIDNLKNNTQLHDCGIVYYPDNPYIFCVMTRGDDFNNQANFIRDLSEFIFSQVDKNK